MIETSTREGRAFEPTKGADMQEELGEALETIEEATEFLTEKPNSRMATTVFDQLRTSAGVAVAGLLGYSTLIEEAQAASENARRVEGGGTMGMRVIPLALTAFAADLVAAGTRPHKCPSCDCAPTGGVGIDTDRSRQATEEASEVLGKFPEEVGEVTILVGTGMSDNLFTTKKRGGGGGGGGPRGKLPTEGAKIRGAYDGEYRTAMIVATAEGPRVEITHGGEIGKQYTSLSKAVQSEWTHTSGPRFFSEYGDDEETAMEANDYSLAKEDD